jgi:hypothetical protein
MTSTVHPTLYNVRTPSDFSVMENDPLERYEVSESWLSFEILGLSAMLEAFTPYEEPEQIEMPLPKRPFLLDNIVNRSVPLFLRM